MEEIINEIHQLEDSKIKNEISKKFDFNFTELNLKKYEENQED